MPPRFRKTDPGQFDEQFEFDLFAPAPEESPPEPESKTEVSIVEEVVEPAPEPVAEPTKPASLDVAPLRKRTFLGWEKSLIDSAVAHFTAGRDPSTPLDLSGHLVVVPTQHSGRRFREALAIHASETQPTAVIPPLVVTPEFFVSPARVSQGQFEKPVAQRAETLMIWTSVLADLALDQFPNLFPVEPVERNLSWALKTAGDLIRVRNLMGEAGLTFAEGARILGQTEMEPERWAELAKLEREAVRATEQAGFFDAAKARNFAATQGNLPDEIGRITLIGTPDPTPLAIEALERISRKTPTEIVIYAPENRFSEFFDEWGRTAPIEDWMAHSIEIPTPEHTIFSESSPTEQAERAADLATQHSDPGATVAIGVPDPEVTAPLEKSLAAHELGGFDPGGKSLAQHSLYYLIGILSRLVTTRSFDSFLDFLRCSEANATLRQRIAEGDEKPGLTFLLGKFDDFTNEHLPDTIDDALNALEFRNKPNDPVLKASIEWLDEWLGRFEKESFGKVLTEFLGEIFSFRRFRSDLADDSVYSSIADKINEVLDAFESPAMQVFTESLDAGDHFDLLLDLLKSESYQPEREASDIDLQGWLELLWENAPHLIVTGMNDGKVPEAIIGHAWLPDSARRALGLRHNDSRYARDVYLMQALIESRRAIGGRVDFIFGRVGASEDPMRPSRLLFQCPDNELPERVAQFFENEGAKGNDDDPMPWEMSWQLRPPAPADDLRIFERLTVTSFKDYLACPFRFYLKNGLRMNEVEIDKTEMHAGEFGTLCHQVLEDLAANEILAKSTDEKQIRDFFHEDVDRLLTRKFGRAWTVPVLIQRRSLHQRLGWWAKIEAHQRSLGWEIIGSELRISPYDDSSDDPEFRIGEMMIRGSIDRVERHPNHGIRIIDFKTFAPFDWQTKQIKSVEDCHLTKIKRTEDASDFPEWAVFENRHWTNLQLPLYLLAAQERFRGEKIEVAYGTIGKAKTEIELQPWPELEGAVLESAKSCAEGVIENVLAKNFWPPADKVDWDDFGKLFFGDAEAAIDPTALG